MRLVVIPKENEREVRSLTSGIEVVLVANVDEAIAALETPRAARRRKRR